MNERRGTKGLELWCRKMTEGYPGVKIDNMTTSWRDGLAFCAIIHHFRPDLIDFTKLNKDDVYHNNELAFRVAEQYLGIPALLEPEDMVEYTVPDRLSILTYLSQFYQTFAVREGASTARIAPKRPQVPSEHGIVSPASTSPPTKVAGKLRREPCSKCGLPVFIAERLNVGKSLFHRTCFRCARCNTELTLANYYETENSEYCCEICPDEEKIASAQKSVLQRSMSDEEKSASLNAFSDEPDEFSAVFESAIENANVEKVHTLNEEFRSARSSFFQSQIPSNESSDSSTDSKEEEPPDLPKTSPPAAKEAAASVTCDSDSGFPNNKDIVNSDNKVSVLSFDQESQNVVTKEESSEESLVKTRRRLFENNVTDIKADVNRKTVPVSSFASIPISIKNDLSNFSDTNKDTKHSRHTYSEKMYDKPPPDVKESPKKSSNMYVNLKVGKEGESVEKNKQENVIINSNNENHLKTDINESVAVEIIKTVEDNINKSEIIDESIKVVNDCVEMMKSLEKDSEVSVTVESTSSADSNNVNNRDSNLNVETIDNSLPSVDNSLPAVDNSLPSVDSSLPSVDNSLPAVDNTLPSLDNSLSDESKIAETVNSNVKINSYSSKREQITETVNYNVKNDNKDVVEAVNTEVLSSPKSESKNDTNYPEDLNPFDEDDEESLNPFGSDNNEENEEILDLKKPVPSPRFQKKKILPDPVMKPIFNRLKNIERVSFNPFESDDEEKPVPVRRKKKISVPKVSLNPFSSDDDEIEDVQIKPVPLPRNQTSTSGDVKPRESLGLLGANYHFGSNSSISSGSHYGSTRKKRPAPKPPVPGFLDVSNASSLTSTPSQSVQHSPKVTPKHRKNKRAPLPPPKFASTPINIQEQKELIKSDNNVFKKDDEIKQDKYIKDEVNRNKQNQNMQNAPLIEDSKSLNTPNKSTYGKWKRKKGQAPTKPVLQKRTIKCLPMAEIKKELEFIDVQLQGLEKQGVRLELIIREKCEGTGNEDTSNDDIPIEVEDLILQLFELVNEKNELFRKQTELMYLRRQQRLEEEHADVEYQIRCLMMQPEANKTDYDKAREEELIKKLVDIVERRNLIVDCLEMDRIREAEEDDSISSHINLYALSRESDKSLSEKGNKEVEKDKKKLKKEKKVKHKNKSNLDADKDVDTSVDSVNTLEKKKKKKFNLF